MKYAHKRIDFRGALRRLQQLVKCLNGEHERERCGKQCGEGLGWVKLRCKHCGHTIEVQGRM